MNVYPVAHIREDWGSKLLDKYEVLKETWELWDVTV